jgi:hypothetical protein
MPTAHIGDSFSVRISVSAGISDRPRGFHPQSLIVRCLMRSHDAAMSPNSLRHLRVPDALHLVVWTLAHLGFRGRASGGVDVRIYVEKET